MTSLTYSNNTQPKLNSDSFMAKAYTRVCLPKSELKDGTWYQGHCRNSAQARWNAEKQRFEYVRTKFSYRFVEEISHPDDEKYYDVFYAQKEIGKDEIINDIL